MLRADEVDLAVGSLLDVPDDISYRPVVTFHPKLIVPEDHALADKESVTLEEIAPYGLILPPRHLSTWRIVDLVFRQNDIQYRVAMEAGGWEVIKRYVELGMGISIVTDVCLTESDNLVCIPLDDYFPKRSYGIVLRRGKFLSPQAKRFLEVVQGVFARRDLQSRSSAVDETEWEEAVLG